MTEIRIVLANRDAIVISIDDNPYIYTETSGEWYDIQLRLPATFSKKLNKRIKKEIRTIMDKLNGMDNYTYYG